MRSLSHRTRKWLTLALMLGALSTARSQVVYFEGLGRAIATNQSLDGNITEGDTSSVQNSIGGYTLFDLGVNIMPGRNFHGRAVLRARNEFGQFFGAGSALSFREIQLEGILAKGIYYEVGDIDLEMTPYTLYNFEETFHDFESKIFADRRSILNYENFNNGNQWRLQGAQTQMNFRPYKWHADLPLRAFAARTKPSDNLGTPDRFMMGFSWGVEFDSLFDVHVNYSNFRDNPAVTDDFHYLNNVITGDLLLPFTIGDLQGALEVESGLSSYNYEDRTSDTTVAYEDFFHDAGVKVSKDQKHTVKLGYKEVGPQYSSPGAQTQRIHPDAQMPLFGQVLQASTNRGQLLYDRYSQESLYNSSLNPVLFQVLPSMRNTEAYGVATPNRRGGYLDISTGDTNSAVSGTLHSVLSQEIVGEGTVDLRKFMLIHAGATIDIQKSLGLSNGLSLTLGLKMDKSSRTGNAPLDFTSNAFDAGVDVEITKGLWAGIGYKGQIVSGKEFIALRDGFNGIQSYALYESDFIENDFAAELRYHFGPTSILRVQYFNVSLSDKDSPTMDYDINQLFINYSITF